ncbi:hypothetical protein Skr01_61820 [Sphaerisporangium krabiense]|uniref:Uncharacterized protein n=1 Tax=Sphaerisporangium krabiense TaxID=763782 RepID=A0A7W8Z2M6_9ACTN|nr:hypothetical protein [Sphaerisporangium krabiense]MBB5626237.1 hypothetical protein [Sphaerisporangium krabiense]GII66097.1 hypothetical protein Skr01_61820 [Sphaerisporangium krabiense]
MSADHDLPAGDEDAALDALLDAAASELDQRLRASAGFDQALLRLMVVAQDQPPRAAGRPGGDAAASIIAIRAKVHSLRQDLALLRGLDRGREYDRQLERPRDPVRDLVHDDLRDGMLGHARDLVGALDLAGAPGAVVDRAGDLVRALTMDRDVNLVLVRARALARTLTILDALGLGAGQYADVFARFQVRGRVHELAGMLDGVRDLNSPLNWAVDLGRAADRIRRIDHDVAAVLAQAGDVVGTISLVRDWKRVLAGAYRLEDDLARAYPCDLTSDLIGDLIDDLIHDLGTVDVDASGLDLRHLDLQEVDALAGVLWTLDTVWPVRIAGQVRARSREIMPGTFRVRGPGTEHEIEDHSAPAH